VVASEGGSYKGVLVSCRTIAIPIQTQHFVVVVRSSVVSELASCVQCCTVVMDVPWLQLAATLRQCRAFVEVEARNCV
jgi:hypothetical protein